MLFRASREGIEMYKDLNWSASLIVLFLSIQCFILFFYTCCKGLKHWKKDCIARLVNGCRFPSAVIVIAYSNCS